MSDVDELSAWVYNAENHLAILTEFNRKPNDTTRILLSEGVRFMQEVILRLNNMKWSSRWADD